ncbi:MAG: hypothetical protein AAFZ58_05090, partial [Pseudomonadota bacterium]
MFAAAISSRISVSLDSWATAHPITKPQLPTQHSNRAHKLDQRAEVEPDEGRHEHGEGNAEHHRVGPLPPGALLVPGAQGPGGQR